MRCTIKKLLSMAAFCSIFLFAQPVFAQNYYNNYQYILGERAAGMGGAYTAIANDSTALWYNPAGLARISDLSMNVSANTYSYMQTKTPGFFELPKADGSTESVDLEESDFSVVGNTLILGKKLGNKQAVSFGLLVPYQDTLLGTLKAKGVNGPGGDTENFQEELSTVSAYTLAMLGYGLKARDNLNIGASLGFGYYQGTTRDSFFYHYIDQNIGAETKYVAVSNTTTDNTQYTLQVGLGMQYEIDKKNKLGVYAQSPTWRISGATKTKGVEYTDLTYYPDPTIDSFGQPSWINKTQKSDPWKQILAGFISLGYAYEKPGSHAFSLDVVPVFGVTDEDNPNKNIVVNVKAGLEKYLSDSLIIRGGLFTDFSQKDAVKLTDFTGTDKLDYYGGTLSLSFGKHFMVNETEKIGSATRYNTVKKSFWSTFGVVGRYGMGDVATLKYTYDATKTIPYDDEPVIKDKSVLNLQAFIAQSMNF